jgi:hypothetical protein
MYYTITVKIHAKNVIWLENYRPRPALASSQRKCVHMFPRSSVIGSATSDICDRYDAEWALWMVQIGFRLSSYASQIEMA